MIAQGIEDVHKKFNARRVSEEHGELFERVWETKSMKGIILVEVLV